MIAADVRIANSDLRSVLRLRASFLNRVRVDASISDVGDARPLVRVGSCREDRTRCFVNRRWRGAPSYHSWRAQKSDGRRRIVCSSIGEKRRRRRRGGRSGSGDGARQAPFDCLAGWPGAACRHSEDNSGERCPLIYRASFVD